MTTKPGRDAAPAGTVRPTLRAVARLAGVAESTVSLVLNGRGDQVRVAAATQRQIIEAARTLDYVPNAAARALATRRSRILGLAMSAANVGVRVHVFADVELSAVEQARESGHFMLQLPDQPGSDDDLLAPIRDSGIAGLICSVWDSTAHLGERLSRAGFPVVWIEPSDRGVPRDDGPVIGIDPAPGMTGLAEHLWDTGRRSIALLIPGKSPPGGARTTALMARFGSAARVITVEDWTVDAGRTAMAGLLAGGDRPDVVFGGNDMVACGALHACRAAGLRVPDDIAVAGYGNFPEADVIEPALTTVSWPLHELGRRAVQTLIRSIEDGESDIERHLTLPTALVRRNSA